MILLLGFTNSYSQNDRNPISAIVGFTQDGYGAMMTYNYSMQGKKSIILSALFTDATYSAQIDKIKYNDITLSLGYSFPLNLSKKRKLVADFDGGGVLGYELYRNENYDLNKGKIVSDNSEVIYGAYLGLGIDYSISRKTFFFIKANGYYHANSDLNTFVPFAGIGLKYYTN